MTKSDFTVVSFNPYFVALIALNRGSCSVTNDAENIIMFLSDRGLTNNHRVFYRDSNKDWDEMLHHDGDFVGFNPVEISMKDHLDNISGFPR